MNTITKAAYTAQEAIGTTIFNFDFGDFDEFVSNTEQTDGEKFIITCNDESIAELFNAFKINQNTLEAWLDADIANLVEHEKAAYYFLAEYSNYDIQQAVEKMDDVRLHQGFLLDAATELFDDVYLDDIPEGAKYYIDYKSFANDCRAGGDMYEFEYAGNKWTCVNSNNI